MLQLIKADMAGVNRIVFRQTAETVSGQKFVRRLLNAISKFNRFDPGSVLDALVLAGEVECALSDAGWGSEAKAAEITDLLSLAFVTGHCDEAKLKALVHELASHPPEAVRVSHPEGFAYYALHPGDFADGVADVDCGFPVAIVGIRSVGTTLSAVACAALRKRGVRASRITLRPAGHPYGRTTELSDRQRDWVRKQQRDASRFMVVDEGPGLSGSSFLSVAESLMREGVGAESITLLGTRDVDPGQLCASNAVARWKKFCSRRVSSRVSLRFKDCTSLSAGAWRNFFLDHRPEQPTYWPEMDGAKYWSVDRKHVFKFEGLGDSGRTIRQRSRILHEAGFGAPVDDAGDGMSCYGFMAGRPLDCSHLSTLVLDRIAEYCAFRIREFSHHSAADAQFEEMVRFNFSQENGRDWPFDAESLRTDHPVIADGRMAPYEWIRTQDARLIKVDASQHGDDHFFPGPTDIHWDIAGAIVEWNMGADAEQYLLSRFRWQSGVIPDRARLFSLAYSTFRASYCKMALMATGVESERPRLERAYRFYREKINHSLRQLDAARAG
ncbi:MAG: hypothetical protein ACM3WP_10750 [Acidobacteriota bacterium]